MLKDFQESLRRRAVGVDLVDDLFSVEVQHGSGFFFVNFQTFADHIEIGVVQAIVLEGAPLHPGDEIFLFIGRKIKNGDDVERIFQHFRLMQVARNAVEHQRVRIGMKPPHLRGGVNEFAPKFDGGPVGHQRTFAGVFNENFPKFAFRAQVAENVAASAVEKIRDNAEHAAVGALARTGRAEHEYGAIFQASLCLSCIS